MSINYKATMNDGKNKPKTKIVTVAAPVSKGDEIYINSDRYKVFTVTHHTTGGISEIDCDAMAPR